MTEREQLIHDLLNAGIIESPAIEAAFRAIDRVDFVPEHLRDEAYLDVALPIGHGQTISQPYTVAFMLKLLDPKAGQIILDVGSGSGWQAALLAHIVGRRGRVIGLELVPELAEEAEANLRTYNFIGRKIAEIRATNAEGGAPDAAPFDRIIAAATAADVPRSWIEQLKPGGIIVLPIGDSLVRVTKQPDGSLEQEEHPGFVFVPFVTG